MSRIPFQPAPDPVTEAQQALREYLHLALSGRFLALQTEDILDAAEFVWNNYEPRAGPPSAGRYGGGPVRTVRRWERLLRIRAVATAAP